MAINGCELKIIELFVKNIQLKITRRPRVLFLGYPDILATEKTFSNLNLTVDWASIAKRSDSRKIWKDHGKDLGDYPMCEAKSLLNALNAECVIVDAISWGGEDFVVDLNLPLSEELAKRLGSFDLIVDPGTVEHCFNIAQVFITINKLVAPLGYVYHQVAVAFPNHGFWSISPTALFDFYESRNYVLGLPYIWRGSCDQQGFEPRFQEILPYAPLTEVASPLGGSFVFQKSANETLETPENFFPIQRCYSGRSRDISMTDFFGNGLPESHRSRLQK